MFSCSCTAQRFSTLSISDVKRCHPPGRTRLTTQAFIPLPGWARRPARISAQHKTKSSSKHPVTQEDINRQRQRFGDRPHRRRPHTGHDKPSLLEEVQQLRSSGEAAAFLAEEWRRLVVRTDNFLGRKLYEYFNWRQDTSKDLVVTFGVFSTLVLAAGLLRRWGVDNQADRAGANLWADIYQVCQWVFGQEFPGPDAPLGQQVMSVGTAMVGLAAFAMVLALVEQVVLETLELNVKRGSKVFESKHYLVLGWCVSQRDVEVVRKTVEQLCVAWKPQGGTTIVVLTQRSKLEMEGMFWRCLPESKRFGTKLVFRQGSPLVPSDLRLVGANRAAATIVVSDQSRSAAEADAQSVRCAILLDELEDDLDDEMWLHPADATSHKKDEELQRDGHVVVELKTANALPLLKYACSSRVMALATSQLNAQRLAKMVKRPVISVISQQLFNFQNGVSMYGQYYKHLCGTRFGDLAYLFPDGIVMGVVDMVTGRAWMAPSKDFVVQEKHSLVICRPTDIGDYRPLDAPQPKSELRLQEALACWVGPTGQSLHDSEWLLQQTPVTTFGTALAAEQRSSHLADVSPTPGPTAVPIGGGSSSSSFLLPASQWSSAISQVELLRQQVKVATPSSDGQPCTMNGGECGAPGFGMQLAGPTATSNNIVPVPQLGSVQVGSMRDALQPSLAVASPAGQPLSSSTGGAEPSTAGTGPTAAASPSISGNTVAAAAQQGVLGLAAAYVHPFCMDTPGSVVLTDASKGVPAARGFTRAGSSDAHSSSSSSSSEGDGAALRTTDWPVLSGAPEHSAKSLWLLPRYAKQQPAQRKRQALQRMSKSSVVGDFTGHGNGVHAKPLQMPHRTGHQPGVLNDAAVLVPPEYYAVDDKPVSVCVLGWGPNSLMASLIKELDHGLSALPKGSEVSFVNMHSPHDSLGQALHNITLENVQVRHVAANPLQRSSLAAALDVRAFRCAVVLCDELWVDPDNNDANGLDSLDEPSVLRLDSLVMVAQLNVRKLLEDSRLPAINIICQKVASEGLTRFEDRHRLPFGVSVNLNSFAAKVLAQIAANPAMLVPVTRLGEDAMLTIADSADYAALGEELNFWQLMARFQVTGDVLLGYYEIPETVDIPLNTVINPSGEERSMPRVWNKGDRNLQFILLCHKQHRHGSTSGSHDDMELESTKQAHWVTARERSPHASSSSLHNTSHANSFTDGH